MQKIIMRLQPVSEPNRTEKSPSFTFGSLKRMFFEIYRVFWTVTVLGFSTGVWNQKQGAENG